MLYIIYYLYCTLYICIGSGWLASHTHALKVILKVQIESICNKLPEWKNCWIV